MKEKLEGWVRTLARLRRMAAAYKAEKDRLYKLWAETDLFRKWDAARLAEKRAKSLAQKADARVRNWRIKLFNGEDKDKILGIAIRVKEPKPVLVIPESHRSLLKEWMWQNARVYLKIDEEALLKMVKDSEVPAELAWIRVQNPKVTATIARDLDKELEAKS